jgi:methylated-DNA-[protein]-cysteine S-methyltransferase
VTLHGTTITTPLGPLSAVADDGGLRACGFWDLDELVADVLDEPVRRTESLGEIETALRAYFDGDPHALGAVPAHQPGGAFRQAAWKVMRDIPPGQTISYAELAARAGSPSAVRAAGSACAQNRIAPVIPCHRIVRTGGGLGGYAYGLAAKEWLLAHERAHLDGAA